MTESKKNFLANYMGSPFVFSKSIIREMLFFMVYSVYLVFEIYHSSFYHVQLGGIHEKWILFGCAFFLILKEFLNTSFQKREIIEAIFCISILILIYFFHDGDVILDSVAWICIFIFSARDIDFTKIAVFTLCISSIMFLFVVLGSQIGWTKDFVEVSFSRIRHYLGFKYSLFGPTIFFNIIALMVYIKRERLSLFMWILMIVANYMLYRWTNARLVFGLGCLLLFMAIILKYQSKKLKSIKILNIGMVCSYIICGMTSLLFTFNYTTGIRWMKFLNTKLVGRLSLGNISIQNYGIHLWGQTIKFVGNGLNENGLKSLKSYNYVDCSYVKLLEQYGIILVFFMIGILTFCLYKKAKEKDIYFLVIFSILAIHAMIDDLILLPYYNTFWLALGGILLGSYRRNNCLPKNMKHEYLHLFLRYD